MSSTTDNWIPDGYMQDVFFQEFPGIHGKARITIRPLAITQQGQVQRELANAESDWDRRQWIAAKWMTQQIVKWDIKKPDGTFVNHQDVSEVMKLRPALFNRLWNVLNNSDGGDIDPDETPYDMHKRAQNELAVAASGGAGVTETLEKN